MRVAYGHLDAEIRSQSRFAHCMREHGIAKKLRKQKTSPVTPLLSIYGA